MRSEREIGVDLLRALCAFLVVSGHFFPVCSTVNLEPAFTAPVPDLFFYALTLASVNCFGVISGYVSYRDEPTRIRVSALVMLWLQMQFYRVLFQVLPYYLGLSEYALSVTEIFFPILRRLNWYFTAYFEMMFIAPLLQRVVRESTRRANACMLVCLFLFTSLAPLLRAFLDCDPFQLEEGYGWIWLSVLYFYGCSLKKHGWFRETPIRRIWIVLAGSLLLSALWRRFCITRFEPGSFLSLRDRMFYVYTSPTLVLTACSMLLLGARARPPEGLRRMIAKASSAALGVFLLHTAVWYWLIEPLLARFPLPSASWGWVWTFAAALLTAFLCTLVDLLRQRLFALLRVRRLADRIQALVFGCFARLSARIAP
ncbi:MAG: acyltransferase [Oscillospiraceae bacterium]|nr:acyltransferase [Oscillospiraceae bacterium]